MQTALASLPSDAWKLLGPPNHQHYHSLSSLLPAFLSANGVESDGNSSASKASGESAATSVSSRESSSALPQPLRELLLVFRSDAMFLTLSGLTGLELQSSSASEEHEENSAGSEEDEEPDEQDTSAADKPDELDGSDASDAAAADEQHASSSGGDDSEEEEEKDVDEVDGKGKGEGEGKEAEPEVPSCKKARLDAAGAAAPQAASAAADSSAHESARCAVEMRRWAPGDYTLASDDAFAHRTASALDALLYVVDGGAISRYGT